jgi:hypothetical protein
MNMTGIREKILLSSKLFCSWKINFVYPDIMLSSDLCSKYWKIRSSSCHTNLCVFATDWLKIRKSFTLSFLIIGMESLWWFILKTDIDFCPSPLPYKCYSIFSQVGCALGQHKGRICKPKWLIFKKTKQEHLQSPHSFL